MDKKIEVRICFGTLCHVMGGAELQLLGEALPPDLKKHVEIKGSTCLEFCHQQGQGQPPFASINGRMLSGCTLQSLIAELYKELN
ncbi:MAG: hypothetical protein IJU72_10380 [Bacteroidales bacterium]|nr:hypothetical protein [Bacteroidales bacterium]